MKGNNLRGRISKSIKEGCWPQLPKHCKTYYDLFLCFPSLSFPATPHHARDSHEEDQKSLPQRTANLTEEENSIQSNKTARNTTTNLSQFAWSHPTVKTEGPMSQGCLCLRETEMAGHPLKDHNAMGSMTWEKT